ncbi:MAG: DegT/DnrJ/EryC1/StrS family aminotransferase [bacterium]|nr:DegT/DnrJ/EryC1/StrS family aminotransferase [bacterium]
MHIPQMEAWFGEEEAKAVSDYLKGNLKGRPWNAEFEKAVRDVTGASFAVTTLNGTISLTQALLALELKPGDEVLVPDSTMIATPNSCLIIGLKPVLVDIEKETLCLDLTRAEEALTPRTKAMMYVPLNGRSGNMDEVVAFCKKHTLFLIEDAAQALGSYYKGTHFFKKHLGTFGDIGSFSFSLFKIISTTQGAVLVTSSEKWNEKIKLLKDFGRTGKGPDIHDHFGFNFKMSGVLALLGVEQFKKLPWRMKRKKEMFARFKDGLADTPQVEFIKTDLSVTTPWFMDIFVDEPAKLATHLKKEGVDTRFFYPPVHTQEVYKKDYVGKSFPVSERYATRGLWLPSSSQLTNEEIDHIIGAIKKFYKVKS